MDLTLLVTDRNLNVLGDPITCWSSIDATVRLNAAGSAHFVAPAHPWIREQIDASHRVVLVRGGDVFIAGPVERYLIEQSDDGENSGVGTITVHWSDDLSLIVSRDAYPDPTVPPQEQAVDEWSWSGNRELGLHALVNLNAGPGALLSRRIPRLVLSGPSGVTSTGSVTTRLELLGEVMRRLAADDVGFRTTQSIADREIVFQTYPLIDASDSVRFGFNLGNLRYLAFERVAPTATTAIVGGQGDGADRYVIERTDSVAEARWGRREILVSRPGTDPLGELQAAGDQELREQAETYRLQTSTFDSPVQRYPQHYDVGTKVSVAVGDGLEVSARVQLVHLQAWATAGELVSSMVGTQDADNDPAWVHRVRFLERKVAELGRTTLPAT